MRTLYSLIVAFVYAVVLKRDAIKTFDDWVAVYRPETLRRDHVSEPVLVSLSDDEATTRAMIANDSRMQRRF